MLQSDFKAGQKWRVVKEGASLTGLQPMHGGYQGWGRKLAVKEVLTCLGIYMTFGDGVPIVKWAGPDGEWLASDCEFQPSEGGLWFSAPVDGFLELIDEES